MPIDPLGLLLVIVAGAIAGAMAWPVKLQRTFAMEHWSFAAWLAGLVVLPWLTLFTVFPPAGQAIADVPLRPLLIANAWSVAWGIANVLFSICLMRIGFGLSTGLLTGIGLPIGILVPMVFQGSGGFAQAPSLLSEAGQIMVGGTAVMVVAVILIAWAGLARDASRTATGSSGGSLTGMAMAASAGVLQVGLSFSFIYSQGPITEAFHARGASPLVANLGVWALVLPGGALINVGYAAWRMTWLRNWGTLLGSPSDFALSVLIGVNFLVFLLCYGLGCQWLGAVGAALGFGVYQAMMIVSAQTVGILGGEWRNTPRRPRWLMACGVILLLAAVALMAWGQS
ncbi:hypothetical protein LBMAG53_24190 [Planctomycetota bacterium]|nr:hypothetical protein LBMAG53_24190 [Planctomycetota bacterium]